MEKEKEPERREPEDDGELDAPPPPPLESRKVRKVTAKDKAAIEALSEGVYVREASGTSDDYLPLVLDRWFQDIDRSCYGLEVAGKIVGFCCRTLLDQGKTYWEEAVRVHPDYRGFGLVKELLRDSETHWNGLAASKTVTRKRYSTYFTEEDKAKKKDQELLFKGTLVNLAVERQQLRSELHELEDFAEYALGLEDFVPLKEIRVPEMLALLQERNIPLLWVNWYGFDVTKENLRMLSSGYVSFLDQKMQFYKMEDETEEEFAEEEEMMGQTPAPRSFSISGLVPKVGGKTLAVYIDAPREKDFITHLHFHITKALDLVCRRIHLHFPLSEERIGLLKANFPFSLTYDLATAVWEEKYPTPAAATK